MESTQKEKWEKDLFCEKKHVHNLWGDQITERQNQMVEKSFKMKRKRNESEIILNQIAPPIALQKY